jgi:hypothetical protein
MTGADTQRIRELNDQARQTLNGCRVLITLGVIALNATDMILDRCPIVFLSATTLAATILFWL